MTGLIGMSVMPNSCVRYKLTGIVLDGAFFYIVAGYGYGGLRSFGDG